MIHNILIISENPFTKRDYERFGIELMEKHFMVHALDLTPWLQPHVWKAYSSSGYTFLARHLIYNEEDFRKYICNIDNCIAIDYLSSGLMQNRIRKRLFNLRIQRVVAPLSSLLPERPKKSILQEIRDLKYRTNIFSLLLSKLIQLTSSLFFRKYLLPDIALVATDENLKDFRLCNAVKISAHSFDYDIYLIKKHAIIGNRKPYIVYIDEDPLGHSDYLSCGWKPFISGERFYPALNKFFSIIEQSTGFDVVIAAHPNSNWCGREHLLNGRIPVYGNTAELIRDSQLVLCHSSVSVGFAVLWHKPLLFITTDELNISPRQLDILVLCASLKSNLINIDCEYADHIEMTRLKKVNHCAYNEYITRYIKKADTPELPIWKIFADRIVDID